MAEQAGEHYSTLALIRTRLDQLPPGEARIGQAILDQPYAALAWSAQEMAERAGVSPATTVRACRRLGFAGLPELRIALAREIGWTRLTADEPAQGPDGLLSVVFNSTSRTLATLAEYVDREAFGKAVEVVDTARRVLFVCAGPTQVVCQDAMFDLTSIGRPVEFFPDTITQTLTASKLSPGDVCIAVGVSGSNEFTLRGAEAARAAGATVLAFTGFGRSILAEFADVSVEMNTPDVDAPMHATVTLVALLLTLRALTMAIAQRRGDPTDPPLLRTIENTLVTRRPKR